MHESMTRLPATPAAVGATARPGLLARFGRALVSAVCALSRRRSDRLALLHMNDHLLADIGLRRMDVQAIACGIVPLEQVSAPPEPAARSAGVESLRPRPAAPDARAELDAAA